MSAEIVAFPNRRRRELGEWLDTGCKAIIAVTLVAGIGFFVFAFGTLFHLWAWWA